MMRFMTTAFEQEMDYCWDLLGCLEVRDFLDLASDRSIGCVPSSDLSSKTSDFKNAIVLIVIFTKLYARLPNDSSSHQVDVP